MLLEHWQVDHLLCNGHHIVSWQVLLWMGFVEKSFFSPMAVCSVNPVGHHATVDLLHMPGQAFFCLKLFLQHIQIYSFITYMSSCSTSSDTNCGHLCVVTSSFSWDVCLYSFMTYRCDKHSFTVSLLIY